MASRPPGKVNEMRRRFTALSGLGFCAIGAFAAALQSRTAPPSAATSSASPRPGPVIRATVRQVLVPVVVTDKKGHYIADLRTPDFEVFEDGVPQKIVALSTTATTEQPAPPAKPAISSHSTQVPIQAETPRRTYLICLDVLHSAFANFGRVRAALVKFFAHEESPDSQYALIALGWKPKVILDSTRDPSAVLAAVKSKKFLDVIQDSEAASLARDKIQFYDVMGGYCAVCACDSTGSTTDQPGCSFAKGRLQLFLESSRERTSILDQNFLRGLTELVRATASMPTTHTILFISDGFSRFPGRELYAIMDGYGPKDRSFQFNPSDSEDPLKSALKLAVRSNVKFYTLDSRGLYAAASLDGNQFDASVGGILPDKVDLNNMSVAHENTDALAQLAHQTGGLFFENSNDLLRGIRRAFADGRESYVLAYVPTNKTSDGNYRKIKVAVKGKNLLVNAKAGYWAPNNDETDR